MFNFIKRKMKKPYEDNCADFTNTPGMSMIYDNDIADFVIRHLKPWDWLNPYKVTCAVQWGFMCLYDEQKHGVDPEVTWKQMF